MAVRERRRYQGVEKFIFVACDFGHAGELFGQVAIPVARQGWQQVVPDPVASKAGLGIRRVDPPIEAMLAQIGHHVGSGYVQQRADQAFAGDGEDGGQSRGARATQKPE